MFYVCAMIRIYMTQQDFKEWRGHLRLRAYKAAKEAAPEAEYVRGQGWCGIGWEKAQIAYCEAMIGKDECDA